MAAVTWNGNAGAAGGICIWSTGAGWSSAPTAPGPDQDVAIAAAGGATIVVTGIQSVHALLLDAPNAVLERDAPLDVAAGVTLAARTLDFNGGTLSAGAYRQDGGLATGGSVAIVSIGTLAQNGGSIVAGAVSLQAGAVVNVGSIAAGVISLLSPIGAVGPAERIVPATSVVPLGALSIMAETVVTPVIGASGTIGVAGSPAIASGPDSIVAAGLASLAIDWTNPAGGDWAAGGNWSSSPADPAAGDNVAIDMPGSYRVTVSGSQAAGSLLLNDAGATLGIDGTLTLGGSVEIGFGTLALGGRLIGTVDNTGTLTTDGTAFGVLDGALLNTGNVVVTQGTLSLDGGGSSSGYSLYGGPTGTLAFGGSASFVVTGGAYAVSNTAINGGTLDLSAAASADFADQLQLSAGGLAFGANTASVRGGLTQTGGTLFGSGTLTVYAGAQLAGGLQTGAGVTRLFGGSTLGGGLALDGGRRLENDGVASWSSGTIVLGGGDAGAAPQAGTLTNAGVLCITAAAAIGPAAGGTGVLDNAGFIVVAGAGETDIDAVLENRGVLEVASGTLSLNGGGSSTGAQLLVSGGAELRFGASVLGGTGGVFRIDGGLYGAADTVVDGGTLDLSGASAIGPLAALSLDHAGGLALGGLAPTVGNLTLTGGALLSGAGTLTANDSVQLGDGVQTGPGTTVLRGLASIAGVVQLDGGRTLDNEGWLTWNGGGIVLGSGDAAAANHAGTLINGRLGLLQIQTAGTIAAPGAGRVINAGMLTKAGGSGATVIAAELTNNGKVVVQGGTLTLDQAVAGNGSFLIQGANGLDFAAAVTGTETIQFLGGGGTLAVAGLGTFGGQVSGFAAGDGLDLTSVAFAPDLAVGFAAGGSSGTLTVGVGTFGAAVSLLGSYTPARFQISDDGHGGVLVGYS